MTTTTTRPAPAGPQAGPAAPEPVKLKTRREPERFALIGVWAIVIVVFALTTDRFLTTGNISSMLGSQTVLLVLALGLLIPLRVGDYDLSVASTLGISAMLVALLNVNHGWGIVPACIVAILAGAVIGAINGAIVVRFEIDPFIVTLGMSTLLQGVLFWMSDSATISGIDPGLSDAVLQSTVASIPVDFWYAVVLCAVIWYVFDFTPFGQRLLFVGQSKDMARLNGIAVGRTRFLALVASGTIAALAGVILAGTTGSADPNSSQSFLLPAFAACFLGSTTLKIGRFNPWGTFIALYFIVTGTTGLQLLGAQNYVQQLFYGAALIIAVILSKILRQRNDRRLQNDARQAALAAAVADANTNTKGNA
ncbi:ABC transporter permease [Patulibacter minatonensis]|uniref:ABC transporter permease n=1 Tax=Patulibacter minatonensis TaxID=298163 RepID=UPI000A0286FE|nr:ABC transporter permease [Patulibacter minatonensis]